MLHWVEYSLQCWGLSMQKSSSLWLVWSMPLSFYVHLALITDLHVLGKAGHRHCILCGSGDVFFSWRFPSSYTPSKKWSYHLLPSQIRVSCKVEEIWWMALGWGEAIHVTKAQNTNENNIIAGLTFSWLSPLICYLIAVCTIEKQGVRKAAEKNQVIPLQVMLLLGTRGWERRWGNHPRKELQYSVEGLACSVSLGTGCFFTS